MKLLLYTLLLISLAANAQQSRIEQVDNLLTEMTRQDLFSGAVLIADSTGILLSKGYGYANRALRITNTPDTRFSLSSGSKILTGTAIVYLAQQGKLRFTDTIGTYIQGLPKGDVITLHQVLTHSAGFDDYFKAKNFSYNNVRNCTDMLPFMRSMPLVYPPGDSCMYSTGNSIILGAVVEQITHMNFTDYIKRSFLRPLKMKNSTFIGYWQLDSTQRKYAVGYAKTDTGYAAKPYNYDPRFIPLSAGGMWSSVNDLYRLDKAVFTNKILDEKYVKQMISPYTRAWDCCQFGYTWIITNKKNYTSIGHAGTSSGWLTKNEYYPKQQYTLIVLSNFGSLDIDGLSDTMEKILFGKSSTVF